jgi:hypothetical protein
MRGLSVRRGRSGSGSRKPGVSSGIPNVLGLLLLLMRRCPALRCRGLRRLVGSVRRSGGGRKLRVDGRRLGRRSWGLLRVGVRVRERIELLRGRGRAASPRRSVLLSVERWMRRLGGRERLRSVRLLLGIDAVERLLVGMLGLLILLLLKLHLALTFRVGVLLGKELIVKLDGRGELRLHVVQHVYKQQNET